LKFIKPEFIISNKYSHLLAVLIVFLLFAPSYEQNIQIPGSNLITITLLITIFMCLRATVENVKMFWLCVIIVTIGFIMDVTSFHIKDFHLAKTLSGIATLIDTIFVALTIILLMRSMFRAAEVDANIIIGGISVYLLIGIFWALIYLLLNDLERNIIELDTDGSLFYFSFTTLTTLGYGDITPKGKVAMMLANFEAISGQMYLTVFVARLVGLHIAKDIKRTPI